MAARGKMVERNWRQSDDAPATIDDISVFVIPILPYKEDYANWKKNRRSHQNHGSSHRKNGQEEPEVQTGTTVGLVASDQSEMEVEAAEEAVVTVNEVSLAIKDDDEVEDVDLDHDNSVEDEEEQPEK